MNKRSVRLTPAVMVSASPDKIDLGGRYDGFQCRLCLDHRSKSKSFAWIGDRGSKNYELVETQKIEEIPMK